jgi:thymidylate kinase
VNAPPLRVSVIGIDGSGKSSTTLKAIELLSAGGVICKPGRDAFAQRDTGRQYCLPGISNFFERLFRRVDTTRRRWLIGASRIAFIAYQRWLEPYMVRRYQPALILSTRCMIIDPAIYGDIYWPALSRVSLRQKIDAFRRLSGLPFRDLYIFLRTPAAVALERIHRRIDQTPGLDQQPREYWLHLYESEAILTKLGDRFAAALAIARSISAFDIVEVETTFRDEAAVAYTIADEIRSRLTTGKRTRMRTCA